MGGRCPVVASVGRTGVEKHVVEVQWNTRKRCFSTSLCSSRSPKETELVVLVRPATDCRRAPTAIGDGAGFTLYWLTLIPDRHVLPAKYPLTI